MTGIVAIPCEDCGMRLRGIAGTEIRCPRCEHETTFPKEPPPEPEAPRQEQGWVRVD
jgi:uncharacterized Zn finger protein (UPF0148 family)